jgi:branched-chain amino acid transport system substrate-binding protein
MQYAKTTRERQRRRVLKTLAAGVAVAGFPAVVRGQTDNIRIGFPVPLTGAFGAEGGLKGRKAELLVRDDKLNPAEAATRTLELIEKDKAHFIVGSLSASVQLSINNVAKQRGVIFVSISQSDAINEAKDWSKYTFHEALNPYMTAGAVGRYLFSKFGKRVVFLTADYAFGNEVVRGFQIAGKPFGIESLADIRHPIGHTDFSTFFPKIQSLKPDLLLICNFGRDQLNAFKQANDFGLKQAMRIAAPLLSYYSRVAAGPQVYQGIVGGTAYFWSLEDKISSAKIFNDKYRALHKGSPPSDYGAYGYSGVKSLLAAVSSADAIDTERVIEALRGLKYDWYKGPQHYRRCDHQAVQTVFVIESKPQQEMKGEHDLFKILGEEKFDESKLRTCQELGHQA